MYWLTKHTNYGVFSVSKITRGNKTYEVGRKTYEVGCKTYEPGCTKKIMGLV